MKRILSFRNDWNGLGPKGSDLVGGVGYYRIQKPLSFLKDKYDVFDLGDPTAAHKKLKGIKDWPFEDLIPNLVHDSDLVLMKNISNPGGLAWFAGSADHYDKPLIVDMDDNYMAVDDLNPRREYFKEDALAQITHRELFKAATAIIVSTEPLVEVYKQFNPNVHVLENYSDHTDWNFKKVSRPDGRIVIGWAGSLTHESDFHVFEPAMHELWKKYGNKIVFSMCGAWPEKLMKDFPKEAYTIFTGTRTMRDYHPRLASWGFDIGVAPLKQSAFNDGKSHGKWMEYAMYRIPTVASNFGPYKRVMVDGSTGLLAETTDEWVEKISRLVDDAALREQIGQTAYDVVVRDWSWRDHAWGWGEVLDRYIGKGFKK